MSEETPATAPSGGADRALLLKSIEVTIHVGLILALVYWSFEIVRPFLTPLLWGVIIAIGSYPLVLWMASKMGGRVGMASLVFTLAALAILIVPSVGVGLTIAEEAQAMATRLRDGTLDVPPPKASVAKWPIIGERVYELWALAERDLEGAARRAAPQLKPVATWLLSTGLKAGLALLQFVFSILVAGLFMAKAKPGRELAVRLTNRLAGERGEELVVLSRNTVESVVRGIIGIAILQAILVAIGFAAIGVPFAGIWAGLCLMLAVVQIDILLILIPMSIYMFGEASGVGATVFLVWNLFVGLINNVLKPILLGRGVDAPMVVVFVGAVGGMMSSGILGLFIGPVVMVLCHNLLQAWLEDQAKPAGEPPVEPSPASEPSPAPA